MSEINASNIVFWGDRVFQESVGHVSELKPGGEWKCEFGNQGLITKTTEGSPYYVSFGKAGNGYFANNTIEAVDIAINGKNSLTRQYAEATIRKLDQT